MTQQFLNESPSNVHDRNLPAVPNTFPAGGAMGAPLPAAPWMDFDRKKEGFSLPAFLHALRRRWIVGLALGFLLASLVAGLLAFLVPINTEATVLFRVRPTEDEGFLGKKQKMTPPEFEVFKKTQADLLNSTFVIHSALRLPGISQLKIVHEKPWGIKRPEEEKVGWLQSSLRVQSPEGTEIVVLSMKERNEDELKQLLNAVKDAFIKEVVTNESIVKNSKLERLKSTYRRNSQITKEKLDQIKTLGETYGSMELDQNKLQIDLAFQRLRQFESEKATISQQMRLLEDDYFIKQQLYQAGQGEQPRVWELEMFLLEMDAEYATLYQELASMKVRASLSGGQFGMSGGAAMQSQLTSIQQQMNQIKNQRKKEVIERVKMAKGGDPQEMQKELGLVANAIQIQRERLKQVMDEYKKEADGLRKMGSANADMQLLQMELSSLQKVQDELKQSIEGLELEISAKGQIQVLQDAYIPAGSMWWIKYMQIGGSWMLTLMLTMFGIAYWDYQSKRVNSTKDVIEDGELRVVGALPLLNGRRAGGLLPVSSHARQTVEIGLARSIDSIRTALLFRKANKPIEVLLVTSALGQEGKTTVASQLAVSLARSGRRTLLVDGDLRNPQQHIVLGMPFNAGLCEFLRGDVALEGAVRTTAAEGLWFMSAGYRDAQTDQSLASPAVSKLIEELRSRFDWIVVDTGPVLTSPDAMLLGQHADAAILSVRRDVSRLPKVREAADRLRSVGVEIAGTVVNGMALDVRQSELQAPPQVSNDPQLERVG